MRVNLTGHTVQRLVPPAQGRVEVFDAARSAVYGEQMPLARHTVEAVCAPVHEAQAGARAPRR